MIEEIHGLMKNNILVDAIDRNITIDNYSGVRTIKFDFNNEYDLSEYDLVVGFRPCSVKEKMTEYSYKYKKDFLIYLCPCVHKPINNNVKKYDEWVNYLIDKINTYKIYDLTVLNDEKMPDGWPILIGKINI